MKTKILITTILVVILLVAAGCKKDPPNDPTPIPEPKVHVYCKDKTCQVESIDPNGTVVFKDLPEKLQPRKDDIIASYPTEIAPYGFLYKVKTVNTSGGKTTVTTEPASIEEAVENANISETISLNDVGRAENSGGNSKAFQIEINKIVPLNGGVSAKLEGTIEMKLTANFELKVEKWRLQSMKFTVTPEITSNIMFDLEGTIQAEQSIHIANVYFDPVTILANGLPIVLSPAAAIDMEVDINGVAKIKAPLVNASYKSVYGVEYKNGKYSAIDEDKSLPANYLDDVTLLLDGKIKVQPQLLIGFMFYGISGMNVYGGMPVKLITDELKQNLSDNFGLEAGNPRMRLSHGLEFGLDLKSKILSKEHADFNTKLTTRNWPVWERNVFPEFENISISNQDASTRVITADVKGWSFMFPIEQHGFCWSTAPMPTVNDNKKEFGKLDVSEGSTSITTTISNLDSKTSYYVRPFFENYFGVFYGQETRFSLGCPEITLDLSALPFGDVTANTSKQLSITVKNTGDETLKISAISSSDPAFTVSSTEFTILPGKEKILFVTFSPAQEKTYSATLTIQSNACEKYKTVTLTGTGVPTPCPVITLIPDSRSFGDVPVNTGEQRQITVKNSGNAILEISSITTSDPAFTVFSTLTTILPGKEDILLVTFTPTQERIYNGTLTIKSNACENTKDVTLTGRGVTLNLVTINNPSVEIGNANNTLPLGWTSLAWHAGLKPHTKFTYLLNEGHNSSRSVKTEVTGAVIDPYTGRFDVEFYDYELPDAKWYFDPVQLEPGKDYLFSDWYKSNVDTEVVLAVTNSAGKQDYIDLPVASKSESWTKYEATFTMPVNGVKASVYHMLRRNGYLITDDYQIAHYKHDGFNHGMVTITFDDGWEENPETALPVMKQYGFKSTQYYATKYIITPWKDPKQQIQKFINAGHEIGSHTVNHPWLTTRTEQEIIRELAESKQYLESFLGETIQHFASSYGDYNIPVKNKIMEYYVTHRTVDAGYNSRDNLDKSRLKNMCVLIDTPIAEFERWVKKAKDEKLWLILLYHKVGGSKSLTIDDTTPEKFAQQMKLLNDYGIEVVTISEALEKIKNQ